MAATAESRVDHTRALPDVKFAGAETAGEGSQFVDWELDLRTGLELVGSPLANLLTDTTSDAADASWIAATDDEKKSRRLLFALLLRATESTARAVVEEAGRANRDGVKAWAALTARFGGRMDQVQVLTDIIYMPRNQFHGKLEEGLNQYTKLVGLAQEVRMR